MFGGINWSKNCILMFHKTRTMEYKLYLEKYPTTSDRPDDAPPSPRTEEPRASRQWKYQLEGVDLKVRI